jgi:hypothetical protein
MKVKYGIFYPPKIPDELKFITPGSTDKMGVKI